jgi:hypothetical protein
MVLGGSRVAATGQGYAYLPFPAQRSEHGPHRGQGSSSLGRARASAFLRRSSNQPVRGNFVPNFVPASAVLTVENRLQTTRIRRKLGLLSPNARDHNPRVGGSSPSSASREILENELIRSRRIGFASHPLQR